MNFAVVHFWLTMIGAAAFLEICDLAFDVRTVPEQGMLALVAFALLARGALRHHMKAGRHG